MTGLVDMFAGLNVTAVSPDRSVTARLAHRGGLVVGFDKRLITDHSEESLAVQLTTAINGALKGYRHAMERIDVEVDRTIGGDSRSRASRRRRSRRELAVRCADLDSKAVSPSGCILVRCRGLYEVDCRIRRGTLSNPDLGFAELSQEVVAAYRAARNRYHQAVHNATGRRPSVNA